METTRFLNNLERGKRMASVMSQLWETFLERVLRRYFGLSVYARIPSSSSIILTGLLVFLLVGVYLVASSVRHEANPSDKLIPTVGQLANGVRLSITPDRNGEIPLLVDTIASLRRFSLGVVIGSAIGILVGLHMGLFPFLEALLFRIVQFFGKIPPMVLMPIIFIMFGLGEFAKVLMVVIGTCPAILLDTYFRTKAIPRQQLVKPLTLGGSTSEVVTIALTQTMPHALNAVRINLLTAWLFLIASE